MLANILVLAIPLFPIIEFFADHHLQYDDISIINPKMTLYLYGFCVAWWILAWEAI